MLKIHTGHEMLYRMQDIDVHVFVWRINFSLLYLNVHQNKMCCCTLHDNFVTKKSFFHLIIIFSIMDIQSITAIRMNKFHFFYLLKWHLKSYELIEITLYLLAKKTFEYLLEGVILQTSWKSLMETYIRHMAIYPNTGAYIGFD